ncbi:not available (plasmid) [Bacillus cereus]|nr:not available [Bacillus cereus]
MFHKCIKKVNKIAIAEEAEMKFLIREYVKGIISSG